MRSRAVLTLATIVSVLFATSPVLATWAVILSDTESGEVGIGQATCVSGIDLRALSAVVVTGRGVATVQAFVDSSGVARTTIRDELLSGTPPAQILNVLETTDPDHETHQYCIVDVANDAATYTGLSAQGFSYAGGRTGQTGPIRYCVAGNILAGAPVVDEAVQAILDTPGTLADKLMAAMQAARSMGGDGRCSCSPSNPTGCGSPPPSFLASAINGYLVVARDGDTPSCASCSGGDYYLDLNVAFQSAGSTDPVLLLQDLYDGFRTDLQQRPDAVRSTVSLDPPALLPDGSSSTTMSVLLLDLEGDPVGVPITSFIVNQAAQSDAVSTIGTPVDNGGGSYSVSITAGSLPGVDRFDVTADDGLRPVTLMPAPKLPVGVPGEVEDARWPGPLAMEWNAAPAAVSYHVYRGDLASLACGSFGDCRDDLDSDLTDLTLADSEVPLPGQAFFYLVTGVDGGGNESVLGTSACGIRSNTAPCP